MPISGSTVVRRQLGRRLRRLREAAGKTDRDIEEACLASRAKLWRIESGKGPVKVADVRALCWLYSADQATTDTLAALAVGTTAQGWWEDFSDVIPGWFSLYVGLEAAATHIQTYDPELVHGLLQTPAYIRGLQEARHPDGLDPVIAQQVVKLRHERQQVLTNRTPPLRVTAVLGAGVLARPVGGRQVMAEQVDRLRELNRRDHIDLRVLPFEVGAHAAMVSPFTVFDFGDPDDPSVAYVETHMGSRYFEKSDELAVHRRIFDLVYRQSVPLEEYSHEHHAVEEVQ